jgi:hypothetical protein
LKSSAWAIASADTQSAEAVDGAGNESDDAEHDSEGGEAFSAFVTAKARSSKLNPDLKSRTLYWRSASSPSLKRFPAQVCEIARGCGFIQDWGGTGECHADEASGENSADFSVRK